MTADHRPTEPSTTSVDLPDDAPTQAMDAVEPAPTRDQVEAWLREGQPPPAPAQTAPPTADQITAWLHAQPPMVARWFLQSLPPPETLGAGPKPSGFTRNEVFIKAGLSNHEGRLGSVEDRVSKLEAAQGKGSGSSSQHGAMGAALALLSSPSPMVKALGAIVAALAALGTILSQCQSVGGG